MAFTKEAVEKISEKFDEPQWMRTARLQGWELFESLPVPSAQHEAWRRTNLRRFRIDSMQPSLNGRASDASAVPDYLAQQLTEDQRGGVLLEIDGELRRFEVSESLKEQGIIFTDMQTAVREHGDLVQRYFMQAVPADEGKFAAMHAAFWQGGVFLYVPKNVSAPPLHSALWATQGMTATHTLIVLDEGAEATIVDEYASGATEEERLHNGVIELYVGDNATLTYVNLQDFDRKTWQFNHERARVGRDGKLFWVCSVMGARLIKAFQTVELDEPGSYAQMSGLFFADGRQHFDLDTQQNHNASDTSSDLLYKGALKNKARSVWQGMIKALPQSQRIDGFQANRNLLLDRDARADSIPGLEIEADDVRCTHASTIGKLDDEQVFYMMSRGIDEPNARQMLVEGFFETVMQRIPFEGVRDRIRARILEKASTDFFEETAIAASA